MRFDPRRWVGVLGALCMLAQVPPPLAPGERVDLGGAKPRAIGVFLERRQDFHALALGEGKVLITGGAATPTSEWFSGATGAFTPGPALVHARSGHRGLRLKDGRVLLLGGTEPAQPAEVSDPKLGQFQALAGEARFGVCAEAVELEDGRVLMVDGASGRSWVWDGRKSPVATGPLNRTRAFFKLTRLGDGKVLVTGGLPLGKAETQPLPAELFAPRSAKWSRLKAALAPRARHQATLAADGRVLLWGGHGADPSVGTSDLEWIHPAKDLVERAGSLHVEWGLLPSLCPIANDRGVLHPDRTRGLVTAHLGELVSLLGSPPQPTLPMANRLQETCLTRVDEGQILVLGTPLAGPSLERWDAKFKATQPYGVLRPGAEGLRVLPDKRVIALGPVVDVLDPKAGTWKPLGWREDLKDLLAKAQPGETPGKAFKTWPKGELRTGAALVPLDKNRVLVVGGQPGSSAGASKYLGIWTANKKAFAAAGTLGTARSFTYERPGGALRLSDGSVLIWGGSE